METGDGWLLRVRLPGGVLTAASLGSVAAVARWYGSGIVELTARANLQLRGFAPEVLATAAQVLVGEGLAAADPASDALRSIAASPLTGHDPEAAVDASITVAAIERALLEASIGAVPSKFAVVVDDGGSWPVFLAADVRFDARAGSGWWVTLRGDTTPAGATNDSVFAAVAAARLCSERGGLMDAVVRDCGRHAVARRLGLTPVDDAPASRPDRRAVGVHFHPDPDRANVVAAPFLGRLDAERLSALARRIRELDVATRITPDRSIALCGVRRRDVAELMPTLEAMGLLTDSGAGATMLSACVGSSGCRSAHADTVSEAGRLAASSPLGRTHLSGCAKGCGAPAGVRHLIADETGRFREAGSR